MTAAEQEAALIHRTGAKRVGHEWKTHCPNHKDEHPSCDFHAEGDRLLFCCRTGCTSSEVFAAFRARYPDIFEGNGRSRGGRLIVATYPYTDEKGALLFEVVRFEPKDFRQRRPARPDDPPDAVRDGFVWKLEGTRRVLFHLPRVLETAKAGGVVYVAEGEKDVLALEGIGLVATTNPQGAEAEWRPEYTEALRGIKGAVILPDNDRPGRKHALKVARSLHAAGVPVKVLELPNLPEKGDVSDWLSAGGTRAQLDELRKAAPRWEPTTTNEAGEEPPAARKAMPAQNQRRPRKGRPIELDDPEPADEPVDASMLLEEIVAMLARFVVLPDHAAEAVALWIAHTYLMGIWDVTPLLALSSPTKRCGKTTLLRVIGQLVRRPLSASGITAPAIFRTVEDCEPTLLIDEMDAMRENEELRAVLNAGHTRDLAFVVRVVGEGSNMEPRRFSVWCPKVLAHIGRLPGTLEDRAIRIPMRRKLAGEKRERIRRRKLEALLVPIRRRLARWAEDVTEDLRTREPEIPEPLDDRAADNWEPLFALADAAGERWPQLAREVAMSLSGERGDDERDENPGLLVLADLRELMESGKVEIEAGVAGDDACTALRDLSERPWKTWGRGRDGLQPVHLARLLRPFGIRPSPVRVGGRGGVRRYPAGALRDAFVRYLPLSVEGATPATGSDPQRANPDGSTSVAGVAGVAGLAECCGSEADAAAEDSSPDETACRNCGSSVCAGGCPPKAEALGVANDGPWLCPTCLERYPAVGREDRLCAWCGQVRDAGEEGRWPR